jgi:hypothetical protein
MRASDAIDFRKISINSNFLPISISIFSRQILLVLSISICRVAIDNSPMIQITQTTKQSYLGIGE